MLGEQLKQTLTGLISKYSCAFGKVAIVDNSWVQKMAPGDVRLSNEAIKVCFSFTSTTALHVAKFTECTLQFLGLGYQGRIATARVMLANIHRNTKLVSSYLAIPDRQQHTSAKRNATAMWVCAADTHPSM